MSNTKDSDRIVWEWIDNAETLAAFFTSDQDLSTLSSAQLDRLCEIVADTHPAARASDAILDRTYTGKFLLTFRG